MMPCEEKIVTILLQHLYCQSFSLKEENISTLMELLDQARLMGVDDLEQRVEEALCNHFLVDIFENEAVENVIEILNEAVKRKCETLVVDAFNCIRENIEMFVASDCFNLLSPESILALFMTSKLRPHLDVEHFNTHFHNSVMKWLFRENEL